jgi:hydrogenase expression/formation protein HypC
MCLAIPGKVLSVTGLNGIIELGGVQRRTSLQLVPKVKVGDYVLVHAGIAIQIVDEEEALATLELFEEYFAAEQAQTEESGR